jgi:nicotinate-nucleotide adenylyltransferase
MSRIGLFGGSFNPIHLGHVLAGHAAAEAVGLDSVWLMPCSVSPFKCGRAELASGEERLEMVRLAAADDPLFEPCGLEVERGGVSYSFDTVCLLRERYPDDQFTFILGADSLRDLSHWHRIGELVSLCSFATVARPGTDVSELNAALASFAPDVRDRLLAGLIPGRLCDVSSSEVRRRIAEGQSIRYLVSPAVEAYIRARGLYGATKEE